MQNDPLVGTQLGAYTIQHQLGEGGMARVYKASHTLLQREVAIKVILPESAGLLAFQQRFKQEAQLVAHLQHRNIVTLYDYGEQAELLYLVMQYVAGGTLRNQLLPGQPLEPHRAALYILQMTRALHYAHQRGIVHRDVKPLNMLVSASNRNELLLSDFGLAKLFASTHHESALIGNQALPEHMMQVSMQGGTPLYMAPEQCLDKVVDARTDIYPLGVILFEMLAGKHPYEGITGNALLYHHAYVPAPSLQKLNPALPEILVQIVERAMAKDPDQRYQSAKDMGLHLEEFLSPKPIPLSPAPEAPVKKRPRVGRSRFSVLLTVFVLVAGIISYLRILPATSSIVNNFSSSTIPCETRESQKYPIAKAFDENFVDDRRGWQLNSWEGITPNLNSQTYTLDVADTNQSFFLCPDPTRVGLLPANFSLSLQITQQSGGNSPFYGIAFRVAYKNQQELSAYAFVINGEKTVLFIEYGKQFTNKSRILQIQRNVTFIQPLTHENTLQVVVHEGQITGIINGHTITFPGPINATSLTGGQPGVLVSGPNSVFNVTHVQLTASG